MNLCNINDQKLKENTKYIVNKTANNVSYGQDIPRHNANRLPGSVSVCTLEVTEVMLFMTFFYHQ